MALRNRMADIPAGEVGTRLPRLTGANAMVLLPVWKRPVLDPALTESAAATCRSAGVRAIRYGRSRLGCPFAASEAFDA